MLCHSGVVLLGVKEVKVKGLDGLRLPQAQGADVVRAIADDRHVIRDGDDGLVGKLDADRLVLAAQAPRVTVAGPIVGLLLLEAALDLLLE